MSRRIVLGAGWLLAALGSGLASGCVERTYTILTLPPGAMVLENGHEIGPAPITRHFRYYGTYRFTIMANGFQTLVVDQPISYPWYEYFPLDFISENLIPWTIRDRRKFEYTLEPMQVVPPDVVKQAGDHLRMESKGIGKPLPPSLGAPVPPGAVLVPPGQPLPPPGQPVPPPGQPILPGQPGSPPGAVPAPPAVGAPQPQPVPLAPGLPQSGR
jgi:hypothetical protein